MKREPVCLSAPKWLKDVQGKKDLFAPFTGQDWPAYSTFMHALELYCSSDDDGRIHALACMCHAVQAMQPTTRWIARESIPHILDWTDRDTLWPRIITAGQSLEAVAR